MFGSFVASELNNFSRSNLAAARLLKVKMQMVLAGGIFEWLNNANQPQPIQILMQQPLSAPPTFEIVPQTDQTIEQPSDASSNYSEMEPTTELPEELIDSNFTVLGEDGEIFDASRHTTMTIIYTDENAIADMKTHKSLAGKFGVYVDCSDDYDLSNGAPVKWIENDRV